jgi:hypothetical protein
MFAILHVLAMFVADMFKSRCQLEAENLFVGHQLNIALRRAGLRSTTMLRGAEAGPANTTDLMTLSLLKTLNVGETPGFIWFLEF